MITADVVIENINGMDSKSAAMLIQKASSYNSEVWFDHNNRRANAKSLLGLLSLCASKGTTVKLVVAGQDEAKAVKEILEYVDDQWAKDSV